MQISKYGNDIAYATLLLLLCCLHYPHITILQNTAHGEIQCWREQEAAAKMAAMAALQSSMTSLSISSNSFFGQRLSFPSLSPVTVSYFSQNSFTVLIK